MKFSEPIVHSPRTETVGMPASFFGLRFLLIMLFLYNVVTVKLMFDSIYIIARVVKTQWEGKRKKSKGKTRNAGGRGRGLLALFVGREFTPALSVHSPKCGCCPSIQNFETR